MSSQTMVVAVFVGAALLGAHAPCIAERAAQPAVYEKKDGDGRILFRVIFRPDGRLNHSAFSYGTGAARVAVEVELDQRRELIREKRETFDEDGRITEREETTVQDSRRQNTRTTFEYDAAGNQTSRTRVE
jgi:YD repeat-containing protein